MGEERYGIWRRRITEWEGVCVWEKREMVFGGLKERMTEGSEWVWEIREMY